MTKKDALSLLWERNYKLNKLYHIDAIIGWDRETVAPLKSGQEQAEMSSLISEYYYSEATSDDIKEAVASITEEECETDEDKAMVRFWKDYYRKEAVLGKEFVSEYSLASSLAQNKWLEARKAKDFSIFAPYLERLVELNREKAKIIDPDKDPYDVLLDLYEPGMSQKLIDPMFSELAACIHTLLAKQDKNICDSFLKCDYEKEKLHSFCENVSKQMGFDLERGAISISEHPFTSTLGQDDIRVTTRYTDPSVMDPISSIVHETGHALYEQNAALNEKIRGTRLSEGVSMGVHESQSRFWENFMGRSRAFWAYQYPFLQEAVPSLKDVDLDTFYKAINKAEISPIRVNADELSYSLHVIMRYELEKKLISGELKVKDLPKAWDAMSLYVLGYKPKDIVEGVLQDCHWAGGSFGYFPTYVLGNFYAAMFLEEMKKSVDVEKALSEGDYKPITDWQNEHIWQYGCIYTPAQLLEKLNGKRLGVNAFCKYLKDKYNN